MWNMLFAIQPYRDRYFLTLVAFLVIKVLTSAAALHAAVKRHVTPVPWSELHHCLTLYDCLLQHFLRNALPLKRWWYLPSIEYF